LQLKRLFLSDTERGMFVLSFMLCLDGNVGALAHKAARQTTAEIERSMLTGVGWLIHVTTD